MATEAEKDFRGVFKYYKSRRPPPALTGLVRVQRAEKGVHQLQYTCLSIPGDVTHLGLMPVETWRVFIVDQHPGAVLVRDPFTRSGQTTWAGTCLRVYADHRNNMEGERKGPITDVYDTSSMSTTTSPLGNITSATPLEKGTTTSLAQAPSYPRTWWEEVLQDSSGVTGTHCRRLRWATLGYHHNWDTKIYSAADVTPIPLPLADLTSALTRGVACYIQGEQQRSPTRSELSPNAGDLKNKSKSKSNSSETVGETGLRVDGENPAPTDASDLTASQLNGFEAQAAIVNFYHPGTSLGPHTDHSEPNKEAPLVSISFGQPCVFLLGGPTPAQQPTPFGLYSGDVLIMGGKARLSYHAVPRVGGQDWEQLGGGDPYGGSRMPPWANAQETFLADDTNDEESSKPEMFNYQKRKSDVSCSNKCDAIEDYMSGAFTLADAEALDSYLSRYRINVNVRQVCRVGNADVSSHQ